MKYSLDALKIGDRIEEAVGNMETLTEALQDQLRSAGLGQAKIFRLPRVTKEEEDSGGPDRIEVDTLTGTEAWSAGLAALSDWYGLPEYSTKHVHRTPGVLTCFTDRGTWLSKTVDAINGLKTDIEHLLRQLPDRNTRYELLHLRFPMVVNRQLLRHLNLIEASPALVSATFTWGSKTEIMKLTVPEAVEKLQKLKQRPEGSDITSWASYVDSEIVRLQSLPAGEELRWRRKLQVRPLVNLRHSLSEDEKAASRIARAQGLPAKQPLTLREAHSPLIVVNPPDRFRIGDLGTFDNNQRATRPPRGTKTEGHPVTELAPIYRLAQRG